jgi:hypothetical protein
LKQGGDDLCCSCRAEKAESEKRAAVREALEAVEKAITKAQHQSEGNAAWEEIDRLLAQLDKEEKAE